MSPRAALIAGVATILTANAFALAGVAYNRTSMQCRLLLSERELRLDPAGHGVQRKENSGLALRLHWRVPVQQREDPSDPMRLYEMQHGQPSWLDERKLIELGFEAVGANTRRGAQALSREVFLVMELGGPAQAAARQLARDIAARAAALAQANPSSRDLQQRAQHAAEALQREESQSSRLFVIDAGRDVEALRAQYADSTRYFILRGRIRPVVTGRPGAEHLSGYIEVVTAGHINVPLSLRAPLEASPKAYVVDLAIGRRLEPWLLGVSARHPVN